MDWMVGQGVTDGMDKWMCRMDGVGVMNRCLGR